MKQVQPFFLGRPPRIELAVHAMFLDLDGTIAEFEIDPSSVGPDARRNDMLRRLNHRLHGRLAIVSGRPIVEVDRILNGRVSAVTGLHGLERRTGEGRCSKAEPHPTVALAYEAFVKLASDHPGVIVEMKDLSVALHYRKRPELAVRLASSVAEIQQGAGLVLQAGNMVFELRTPGADKGDAVRAFMAEPPFVGAIPIYLGDDQTDENAFIAVEALGGFGVLVGEARSTAAGFRLDGVTDAIDWLDSLEPPQPRPLKVAAIAHV